MFALRNNLKYLIKERPNRHRQIKDEDELFSRREALKFPCGIFHDASFRTKLDPLPDGNCLRSYTAFCVKNGQEVNADWCDGVEIGFLSGFPNPHFVLCKGSHSPIHLLLKYSCALHIWCPD